MRYTQRLACLSVFCLLFVVAGLAQEQRAFNQNSSRSNHTRYTDRTDSWSFGIGTGAAFAAGSNENTLFRGNSISTKLSANYFFGTIGLGIASGLLAGDLSNGSLNSFLAERKFPQDQVQIAKGKPFNSYFLAGPSFRFGHRVSVHADLQAGLFFNNPGALNITQTGASRSLYRFDSGDKNLFPGFSGNMGLAYPLNPTTSFTLNAGYLQSRSSVRLLDPQRGIDVATQVNRDIKLITAGIGIIKSFGGGREAGSGLSTGKKHIGNVKYEDLKIVSRDAQSGLATGRRILTDGGTGSVVSPRDAASGLPTGRREAVVPDNQSCGPVTQRITRPDGTTEEISFSCAADAAAYNERISMNVTVPKQTQGATFGEKVNAGLHAAGGALSQGASLAADPGVISGRVSRSQPGFSSSGIVTNQNVVSSVGSLAGGGGGAAAASYAATGRMMNNADQVHGPVIVIYAREAGSGMATGRRHYEPVFSEQENNACTGCAVNAKLTAHELTHVVQQRNGSAKENPLYTGSGQQGTNPMFENKKATAATEDCDGVAGLDVYLLEPGSGAVISYTKTGPCGDFFFANVPASTYIVKVTGSLHEKKDYAVTVNQERIVDVAGQLLAGENQWIVQINSSAGAGNNQKVSINTTRSNIKRVTLIGSDTDGDGTPESFRAIGTFSDGSSGELVAKTGNNSLAVSLPADNSNSRAGKQSANLVGLNLSAKYTVIATFSDGSNRDITADAKLTPHPNVVQLSFDLDDTDGDGFADAVVKTKTKSNQSNDRIASGDPDSDGLVWSPKSNIRSLVTGTGDLDGDGSNEILAGNAFTGGATQTTRPEAATLLGGALPGGAVISAAMRPGGPIGGIIVKGGKNPGGSLRTTQTNDSGEFEFPGLDKGTYTISFGLDYYIDDESIVTVGGEESERKGWDGTVKGGSKTENQSQQRKLKGKVIKSGDNGMLLADANEPLTFNWTPSKSAGSVTYRLKVWQLMQGQNGTAAMRNQPLVDKTVTGVTETSVDNILTGPCKPPYLCDFIWSVQAISTRGIPEGNPETGSFSTGSNK